MRQCRIQILMGAAFAILSPVLNAQSCIGNSMVGGGYALVGSRFAFAGVSATPPGTSGGTDNTGSVNSSQAASEVSNTPIGRLLSDLAGSSPFGVVSRINADGAGNLFAAPDSTSAVIEVGSYSVNADCTISVTLRDAFLGMPITPPGTSGSASHMASTRENRSAPRDTGGGATTPVTIQLDGVVLGSGSEVHLTQAGASNTGAVITMRRLLQFGGCTDASLNGSIGVVSQASVSPGSDVGGGSASSLTSASLLGRLVADGAGTFIADPLAKQSPLPSLQLTGTYTVNTDCSGSAQVVDAGGTTRNVEFVIVQADALPSPTAPAVVRPELLFSFSDQGINGLGIAK
jgi:hypothetical protein